MPFRGQTHISSILYPIHKIIIVLCAVCTCEYGELISLLNILGKSIDNSLTQNYQPLEYENPSSAPKFISRGQSYRTVIGDTIILPCATQYLGEKTNKLFSPIQISPYCVCSTIVSLHIIVDLNIIIIIVFTVKGSEIF